MLNQKQLDEMLTTPSAKLIEDIGKIEGDIMILGAGGKMGPSLCVLAANAVKAAGIKKRIIAVSRFSSEEAVQKLESAGVEVIRADLQKREELDALPETENVIYMAGRKFGTEGHEWETWGMNATLSAFVAEKFKKSRIVVFSSANIYSIAPVRNGGPSEEDAVVPMGEYPMSCLARERAFEYSANTYGTKGFIYRLCFAIGLDADSPAVKMNISGPEVISVEYAARRMGKGLGIEPVFEGVPQNDAYLVNTMKCTQTFGYPAISAGELMDLQVEWLKSDGRTLNKPTHFEARNGKY